MQGYYKRLLRIEKINESIKLLFNGACAHSAIIIIISSV